MRQRAAEGGIAAADTDVNGLMRANRTAGQGGKTGRNFLSLASYFLLLRGDADRALFGARMSVRCIERRGFLPCNLGGTAGTYLLSHFSGAGVFYFYRVH